MSEKFDTLINQTGKICLAMMVKNEEKTILKSFNSCKSIVESIKIYDTGSTDKTLELIEQFKTENPNIDVQVIQGEFVDFATSRNVLLDFVDLDYNVQFAILLDSNDELHGGEELKALVEHEKNKTPENTKYYCSGYLCRQKWFSGNSVDTYYNVRFIRVRHEWRYKSPVHEYISSPQEGIGVAMRIENPNIVVYQDRTRDCESSFKRFERDEGILLREHLKNPDDARIVFYLAQTYASLGKQNEAYYYYKLRLELGAFEEEIYHSYMRLGEIALNLRMDSSIFIGWWMKALEHTMRVEPAVNIADYYLFKCQHKQYLAAAFTTIAVQMGEPPIHCTLFVNRLHYDYTRYHLDGVAQYYMNNYKQGLDSTKKALEYNENKLEPILKDIQNLTTCFTQGVLSTNPKLAASVMDCIHLCHSGHVHYVKKLCNPPVDAAETQLDSSPYYPPEYIDFAKSGSLKQIMQYTNSILVELHLQIVNEKEPEKAQALVTKRQEIFKYNDSLMDVAIHSLQTKLVLTETQCNTLVDIVMQAIQKNSYQMKMDADKGNIKFYNDKLEELEKGKEINPPNIQVTHVQQETNDGAAKKKKKNKKKNGKK
jgi:glycosyltransferase involved in cell wall biosynthesis